MSNMYDIARQITDNVLGEGTYAKLNAGHLDPGVQAAIKRSKSEERRLERMEPEPARTAWCNGCQANIEVPWENPPYSVMWRGSKEEHEHLHPVTREAVADAKRS